MGAVITQAVRVPSPFLEFGDWVVWNLARFFLNHAGYSGIFGPEGKLKKARKKSKEQNRILEKNENN